ncbi:MAG: hypothetical protein ACJ8CB_19285, partial [Ktedonobacteraceae bacterium]
MRNLPASTITLLFTDIEGSTRLLQRLGDRYAEVLAGCRHLLRGVFLDFHGHEVDTQGDAFQDPQYQSQPFACSAHTVHRT